MNVLDMFRENLCTNTYVYQLEPIDRSPFRKKQFHCTSRLVTVAQPMKALALCPSTRLEILKHTAFSIYMPDTHDYIVHVHLHSNCYSTVLTWDLNSQPLGSLYIHLPATPPSRRHMYWFIWRLSSLIWSTYFSNLKAFGIGVCCWGMSNLF